VLERVASIEGVARSAMPPPRRDPGATLPVPAVVVAASVIAPPPRNGSALILTQLLAQEGVADPESELGARDVARRYAASAHAQPSSSASLIA
jgi:hypothetical protein